MSENKKTYTQNSAEFLSSLNEEQLITTYLPVVKSLAEILKSRCPPYIRFDELYSAGTIGLLDAVKKFRHEQAEAFEGYVRVRIRGAMLDELRRSSITPRRYIRFRREITELRIRLEAIHMREITNEELAKELNMPLQKFNQWINKSMPSIIIHLDSHDQVSPYKERSTHELIPDEAEEERRSNNERREYLLEAKKLIKDLPEKIADAINSYYFDEMTLDEIAEESGCTKSRVCQRIKRGIRLIHLKMKKRII